MADLLKPKFINSPKDEVVDTFEDDAPYSRAGEIRAKLIEMANAELGREATPEELDKMVSNFFENEDREKKLIGGAGMGALGLGAMGAYPLNAIGKAGAEGFGTTIGNLSNPTVWANNILPGAGALRTLQRAWDDPDVRNYKENPSAAGKKVGEIAGDVFTGEGIPKFAMDYVGKPALQAVSGAGKAVLDKGGELAGDVAGTDLGKVLKAVLKTAVPVARAAAGDMGLGQLWNVTGQALGGLSDNLGAEFGQADEKAAPAPAESVTAPKFTVDTPKAEYTQAKKDLLSADEQKWAGKKETSKAEVVAKLNEKAKVTEPIAAGKDAPATATATATPKKEPKKGILKTIQEQLGEVDAATIDKAERNYPEEYYNTLVPRYFKPDLKWEEKKDEKLARLNGIEERALYGRKAGFLDDYYRASKSHISVNENMRGLINLFEQNTKPSDAALIYAACKASDSGGRVTDADIDNYKKNGTDLTGKISEFFRQHVSKDGTLLPGHRKQIVDTALQTWKESMNAQFTNRDKYIKYSETLGIPYEDAVKTIEVDGLGKYGSTADELIKGTVQKMDKIYNKQSSPVAEMDDTAKAWLKAIKAGSKSVTTDVLKSFQMDYPDTFQNEILPVLSTEQKKALGL